MSPRPDVSEERRNQILEAAALVFARSGFSKARMDDIAAECGLSKGTLYWYFNSKDEIILAMLDRLFERELADLHTLQESGRTATECLLEYTEIAILDMTHLLQLMPIAYEYLALAFRNEAVLQALKRYSRSYFELIIPIIQQGIDNGEFRQVDPQDVAIAVGAIFEGTALLWVYDSETIQIEKHIRSSINLLLDGLQA
ncbi:MAG: TetR/AcrR family transcriptional regulator [Anaerolineales bacterium]|nr:TetR/AcrR family transcriptional regulator [Anaerolineales bacterium]